ncbi:glycosyltransferase family 2 protein [Calditrichota bacterium]
MRNNTKNISVVIPLFNKARHIRRALNSVLAQTYENFDVIVVNDGSTDGSEKVVEQYTEKRIRLVNQEHAGVSAARNRGIQEAEPELIAFLDADDEWMPEFLETVIALNDKYPQAAIWATGFNTISANGDVMSSPKNFSSITSTDDKHLINIFKSLPYYKYFWTSSILASKKAIQSVGGFPEYYQISQDTYLWNRLAFNYPVSYCPAFKAIYHMDADNHAFANHDVIYIGVDPIITAFLDYKSSGSNYTPITNDIYKHVVKYILRSLVHNAVCKDKIAIFDTIQICIRIKDLRVLTPICLFAYVFSMLPKILILIIYNGYRLLSFKKPRYPKFKSHYTESAQGYSIFQLSRHSRDNNAYYSNK